VRSREFVLIVSLRMAALQRGNEGMKTSVLFPLEDDGVSVLAHLCSLGLWLPRLPTFARPRAKSPATKTLSEATEVKKGPIPDSTFAGRPATRRSRRRSRSSRSPSRHGWRARAASKRPIMPLSRSAALPQAFAARARSDLQGHRSAGLDGPAHSESPEVQRHRIGQSRDRNRRRPGGSEVAR